MLTLHTFLDTTGLLLRIGLNPSIPIRDEQESVKRWYGVNRSTIVYPYIGVGYAF